MVLGSPLDDAFSYLFEEFLLIRKADWSAREEKNSVSNLLELLQMDEKGEIINPDEILEFLQDEHVNPKSRNALVEALGKYYWEDGLIGEDATRKPRRIASNEAAKWSGSESIIGHPSIYRLLEEVREAAEQEIYDSSKLWQWVQRDRERAEHVRNGIPCPHCDHGERRIPMKGSQLTKLVDCKSCHGTGLYQKGGHLRSQNHAAEIKQRLTNAGHNAWAIEPTERTIQEELRLMEMSNDETVRAMARDPDMAEEARRVAILKAKSKAILPDPRTLEYNERHAALARLRVSLADMMAWERTEAILEDDQSIYDLEKFPRKEYEDEEGNIVGDNPHEGVLDRLWEDINERIWGSDEAPNEFMREKIEAMVARRREAYQGDNFDEGRAEHEAFMSIMEPKLKKALVRYFRPYCLKAVDENINYVTTKAYLQAEKLDVRVHPEDMDIIEQVRAEQAGLKLKQFWDIATSYNRGVAFGVNVRENPLTGEEEVVTSQDDNFHKIIDTWRDLVSGTIDEQMQAKHLLQTQIELPDGDTLPLLSFIFQVGKDQDRLPENAEELFAEAMVKYPHPIALLHPEWKDQKTLENFLSVKSGKLGRRAQGIQSSHAVGDEIEYDEDEEPDIPYDTELEESTERPDIRVNPDEVQYGDEREDDLWFADNPDSAWAQMNDLPGLKSFTIPYNTVTAEREGDAPPPLLRSEDRLRRHLRMDDLSGITREMLATLHDMVNGLLDENVRERRLQTESAATRQALLDLAGEGEFGHQYRNWLDDLIHNGEFKRKENIKIGGKRENSFQLWNRMKTLVEILLDRETGAEKDYDAIARHPEFQKILNRDILGEHPMMEFRGNKSREEREQIRRMFSDERRHPDTGITRKCPKCDDSGRNRITQDPCDNTVGEGDNMARCTGMNRYAKAGTGRLYYVKPFNPSVESSKAKIDSLRRDLLGQTQYEIWDEKTNKTDYIYEVGKPDPDYQAPEGKKIMNASFEAGLIQQAHEYDMEAAHNSGYRTLCPRCQGSGQVEGNACPTCSNSKYTIRENGKTYIPDTRLLRELNSGSRESGLSSMQSALSLKARQQALVEYARLELRRRGGKCENVDPVTQQVCGRHHPSLPDGCQCREEAGGFQPSERVDERRHQTLSSLENRAIPPDANTNPFEIHPLLMWPDYHRIGQPMSLAALKANFEKVNRDPEAFKQRYSDYFENIAYHLTGTERDIVESNKPSLAVECALFQQVVDALSAGDDHMLQLCHNLISVPDIDGRNRNLDAGYMTQIECKTCKGTGFKRYPNGDVSPWNLCDACKGTKKEGVAQWIKRNKDYASQLSGKEIRKLSIQGKLDRERNDHSSLVDNSHISLEGRMCDTCRCGHSHAIYDSDKSGLDLITGGRRDDTFARGSIYEIPVCKKCMRHSKATDIYNDPCECDEFEPEDPKVILEGNPHRLDTVGTSRSSIWRRHPNILPAHREKPVLYRRTQVDLNRLISLMKDVRRIGRSPNTRIRSLLTSGQRESENWLRFWNPESGNVEEMTWPEYEQRISEMIDILRHDDVRKAWKERYKDTAELPEFGPDVTTREELSWKDEPIYEIEGEEEDEEGRQRLKVRPKTIMQGGDESIPIEERAMDMPCPWCLRKNRHHQHHDVHTLRQHMAEAEQLEGKRVTGPRHETVWTCPRAQEEYDELRSRNDHHGADAPPKIFDMRDDYAHRSRLYEKDKNLLIYEHLMRELEPHLRAIDSGRGHDPFSKTMKAIKPGQVLGIPTIQRVPSALMASARASTMEGGNPHGVGGPMSVSDIYSSALPESLDDTMAFLRAVEQNLPSSRRAIRDCKRLLAMHILDPDMRADEHRNLLNLRKEYRNDSGAISANLKERLALPKRIHEHERFLWAMRVLGKTTDNVNLTKAEREEFAADFNKINPLLGLNHEWMKYLEKEPHRAQSLMNHAAIGSDVDVSHPILKSLFDFDAEKAHSESLFHVGMGPGLYDDELDWIDFVLDALNRDAARNVIENGPAFYNADEHGFMQPYEHHPSMWSFFYGTDMTHVDEPSERHGLGHYPPQLMQAWINHDNETLRGFDEMFDVEGKTLEQMRESGILDKLWSGITGGRDAWTIGYDRDPTNDAEVKVWKKLFSGTVFPTLDEMASLSDRDYHSYKGAWYHLRREMMMRASMPELSRERLRKAGQFQAPIGRNTLGTGTRCMLCQGHGVHHSVDEAAIIYGILHPFEDDYGNHISLPSVEITAQGYFDSNNHWIEDPENNSGKAFERTMRVLLPTHDGSDWKGDGDGWEGRIDWANPIAKAFVHNEMKTPYGHIGEDGWDEYYDMMLSHNPEIEEHEQDWLTAQEYSCLGCHGTGHCGGCGGAGTHEREEGEHQAVLDINLLLTLMHNRGVGIEIGDDGMSRYIPENAIFQKPTFSNIAVLDNGATLGQRRIYFDGLPEEYQPMEFINDEGQEAKVGGQVEYKKWHEKKMARAFDDLMTRIARNKHDGPPKDFQFPSTLQWSNGDRKRWYEDNEVLDEDGEPIDDLYERHHKWIKDSLPTYAEWRLSEYLRVDPKDWLRTINNIRAGTEDMSYRPVMEGDTAEEAEAKRGKMATYQVWPGGTFSQWFDGELHPSGDKAPHSATEAQEAITHSLLNLSSQELAELMYAHYDAKKHGTLFTQRENMLLETLPWFTESHKQALLDTGTIFPPNHFDEWESRRFVPQKDEEGNEVLGRQVSGVRCEHPECAEMQDCMYCNATGEVKGHTCRHCQGETQYPQSVFATHGPTSPNGEAFNEHGWFCQTHHNEVEKKMRGMNWEDMEPATRRIVGGDFVRKLIRYTDLTKDDLLRSIEGDHPDAVTIGHLQASGILGLAQTGLAFIGLHKVVGQTGQEDYYIPMFQRGNKKFSIFDLGLAHTTNTDGVGNQPLFQKRDEHAGYFRNVDLFDSPAWSEQHIGNAITRVKTSKRDDRYNLGSKWVDGGIEPVNPKYKNFSQYQYPQRQTICPNCKGLLRGVKGADGLYHECTNRMEGSEYGWTTKGYDGTGRCNWPGWRLDGSDRAQIIKKLPLADQPPMEVHARDLLIHPNGVDEPAHVTERNERERLKARLEGIKSGEGDPAIDKHGKLNSSTRRVRHPVTNHRGEPILDQHGNIAQRVTELPPDAPLCTWLKYTGSPSFAAEEHEPFAVKEKKKVEDFINQFYTACFQYEDGVLKTTAEGQPVIEQRDWNAIHQLAILLREDFRLPVMHQGFGSKLGTSNKPTECIYGGLTSPSAVQRLHDYVNTKFRTQSFLAKRESRAIMAMLTSTHIDPHGTYRDLPSIGRAVPQPSGQLKFIFNDKFIKHMERLQKRYEKGNLPSHLDEQQVKRVLDHYERDPETGTSKMQEAFNVHIRNESQKRWFLRLPREADILERDNDMTVDTVSQEQAADLLRKFNRGEETQRPLIREGADPNMVEAHRVKTFGIRPDRYHEIMDQYAEEAHDNALEFQTTHFPYQASLESLGRGKSVQNQVGSILRDMSVLGAETHMDVLDEGSLYPEMRPEQRVEDVETGGLRGPIHCETCMGTGKYTSQERVWTEDEEGNGKYEWQPRHYAGPCTSCNGTGDGTRPATEERTTTTHYDWDKEGEHHPSNAKQWYAHANRTVAETSSWNTSAPATLAEGPPMFPTPETSEVPTLPSGRPATSAFAEQEAEREVDDSQ